MCRKCKENLLIKLGLPVNNCHKILDKILSILWFL
jgi:hypothetical protein